MRQLPKQRNCLPNNVQRLPAFFSFSSVLAKTKYERRALARIPLRKLIQNNDLSRIRTRCWVRVCATDAVEKFRLGESVRAGCDVIGSDCAEKNLRLCRYGAFENPQCTWAPHDRVSDPTTHSVGLRAPDRLLAPAGTPSVRQKNRQVTYTAEVL